MSDGRRTIVIVSPDLGAGGSVSDIAMRHARELAANHRVVLMSRSAPQAVPARVEMITVVARRWNWLRRFCHVPNEVAFALAVRQALLRVHEHSPIDIVWCHSHATAALSAAPLRRLGVQSFMTAHGDIFDRPAGTYASELAWFYRQVTPAAYRLCDRVQVLSPAMRDRAIASGAAPALVHVIPNGLDAAEIGLPADTPPRPAESFLPGHSLRLLYVGNLLHVKGPDVLLHAVRILRDDTAGGLDASACFVGGGPPGELEKLAAQLRLGDHVRFLGSQPRTSLGLHYTHCDIVCIPSRSEPLSLAALEAMMSGAPVVASRTGGLVTVVTDGVTGCLANAGDPQDLARAIRQAASSREHLAQMGQRGFDKVRREYSWPQVAAQLQSMVDGAMNGTQTRS